MTPERDKQAIRFVGGLTMGLGMILMAITILATLLSLFTVPTGNLIPGAIAIGLALVMSSTLMSCGTQFQRLRIFTEIDIETMRHCWSALLVVMVLGGAAGIWYAPPLTAIAGLVVFLLLTIRPAVIRLSG